MSGERILERVRRQVALGPRVPGTPGHETLQRQLLGELAAWADSVHAQRFPLRFGGRTVTCANLVGVFRARPGADPAASTGGDARPGFDAAPDDAHSVDLIRRVGQHRRAPSGADATRRREAPPGPLLLGTHYDTRRIADREPDPPRRRLPIPGANDGGSGTAVLLELLPFLARGPRPRDVYLVFFDAEDVGGLDGQPFAAGAARLALPPFGRGLDPAPAPGAWPGPPSEVIVLDMVGGRDMAFDLDAHRELHAPSAALTDRVFGIGAGAGLAPFLRARGKPPRAVIADHLPFLLRGTASCLLIDLDYPQWHTLGDLPEAMAEESLEATAEALRRFLRPPEG